MNIKILGSGCANCTKLYTLTEAVIAELGITSELEKITDIPGIMAYGVMSTPALVINEKVKACGRLPGKAEIKQYILEET